MKLYCYLLPCLFIFSIFFSSFSQEGNIAYEFVLVQPSNCDTDQFFDFANLDCNNCSQNSTFQKTSSDGFSCSCQTNYYRQDVIAADGTLRWNCEQCPPGEQPSEDGYSCVPCFTDCSDDCSTDIFTLPADRNLSGSFLDSGYECIACVEDTAPNTGGQRCVRCNQPLAVQNGTCECTPNQQADGLCFRYAEDLVPETQSLYTVYYEGESGDIESQLFKNRLRGAHGACVNWTRNNASRIRSEYSNITACQLLGNLCCLSLYESRYAPETNLGNDACVLHQRLLTDYESNTFPAHQPGLLGEPLWRDCMPWLYYESNIDNNILHAPDIITSYTDGDMLDLVIAHYNLEGRFVSLTNVTASQLQICPDDNSRLMAAFVFGVGYSKKCEISSLSLLTAERYATQFFDIYLRYQLQGVNTLYPVPVLIRNYRDTDGYFINREPDSTSWQLFRRYFLVDRAAGNPTSSNDRVPDVIRYAARIFLHVTLRPKVPGENNDGHIYPPWLEITYAEIVKPYTDSTTVTCSFEVLYDMNTGRPQFVATILISVLTVAGVVIAAIKSNSWNKREGKAFVDCVTLFRFLIFLIQFMANSFLVAIVFLAIWWFSVYKSQDVFVMVPAAGYDSIIILFVNIAFGLKCVDLFQILYSQTSINIFFIDWERPPKVSAVMDEQSIMNTLSSKANLVAKLLKKNTPVSVWRTYFIANEWCELQVWRRCKPGLLILSCLFLLHSIGLQHLALYESAATVTVSTDQSDIGYNATFRFAVLSIVFIGSALLYWLFDWLIWSRYIKSPINNFVDVCSLANISVIALPNEEYGYYIHGRSPHGFADVGLKEMMSNRIREQNGHCSERGLIGDSVQTWEVCLPRKLCDEYRKMRIQVALTMAEAEKTHRHAQATNSVLATGELEKMTDQNIEVYHLINIYFQNFIDHNITDLNYVCRQKTFTERLLGTEAEDNTDIGYFYEDKGYRFCELFYCGKEASLLVFLLLLMAALDLLFKNYILAGIVTVAIDTVIASLVMSLGTKNLAKKALINRLLLT